MDLSSCATAQWLVDVALRRPRRTHQLAAVQLRIEAFQQFSVESADLQITESRYDVEPDQVLVPVARRLLQLGYGHPLLDGLGNRDGGLGLSVEVDVALQAGELLLRLCSGLPRLAHVAAPTGQRVDAHGNHRPVASGRQWLDVPAAAGPGRHGCTVSPTDPTHDPTR